MNTKILIKAHIKDDFYISEPICAILEISTTCIIRFKKLNHEIQQLSEKPEETLYHSDITFIEREKNNDQTLEIVENLPTNNNLQTELCRIVFHGNENISWIAYLKNSNIKVTTDIVKIDSLENILK